MNTQWPFFPTLLRSSALFLVLILASACSKTVKWKEEVQLSNGRVIVVERATQHRPGGAELSVGTGWKPAKYVIRFEHPPGSNKLVEWYSTKTDVEGGAWPEFPLVLDESTEGITFIITIHALRGACFEYVRYVFSNGTWSEVSLPAQFESRDANLYIAAAALNMPRQISMKDKKTAFDDFQYSMRFKKIGPKQIDCRA